MNNDIPENKTVMNGIYRKWNSGMQNLRINSIPQYGTLSIRILDCKTLEEIAFHSIEWHSPTPG